MVAIEGSEMSCSDEANSSCLICRKKTRLTTTNIEKAVKIQLPSRHYLIYIRLLTFLMV